jgi:hypothetical protein
MSDETVTGYVIDGWSTSIAQLWGSGPKLTIKCGGCKRYYEKRVAPAHRPVVVCPRCGRLNRLDITT